MWAGVHVGTPHPCGAQELGSAGERGDRAGGGGDGGVASATQVRAAVDRVRRSGHPCCEEAVVSCGAEMGSGRPGGGAGGNRPRLPAGARPPIGNTQPT